VNLGCFIFENRAVESLAIWSFEWASSRQHFVQCDAQRIDNRARVDDGTPTQEFRRHVVGSPHEVTTLSQHWTCIFEVARKPEIEDHRMRLWGHHDVPGLDVSVNDARLMSCVKCPGRFGYERNS
jgi:hypothetical protein